MMYCYIPDSGNDIFRHFISMNSYKNIPLWQCFGNSTFQSGVFTWDLWLWVIARFNNMQLLQASGAFVAYTVLTWMIFDYACFNCLKMKQWITTLLIGVTIVPILDIGIGIRYANAFIIAGYAFYRHYIKNIGIIQTICGLLAAVFLHHAMILWNLSYIVFIEGVSMSFNLGSNGNRFFVMSMILSLIPFAQSIEERPFLAKRKCCCLDIAIMFCAAGSFALYLYNMNWGSGSLASFLLGGIAAPSMMIP